MGGLLCTQQFPEHNEVHNNSKRVFINTFLGIHSVIKLGDRGRSQRRPMRVLVQTPLSQYSSTIFMPYLLSHKI